MSSLSEVPTCELVEELKRREGVESVSLSPYAEATVPAEGPAVVLVVNRPSRRRMTPAYHSRSGLSPAKPFSIGSNSSNRSAFIT